MNMKKIKIQICNDERGLTLIEIIMSLVILSIIGVFGSMWLMTIVNGYILTKSNADTIQNAEIILARLSKELSSTSSITSGNNTSLDFLSKSTNPVDQPLTLSWASGTPNLSLGADLLANKIASFNLKYHAKYDDTGENNYSKASTAVITITLRLIGAETTNFEERVYLHGIMTGT
jgi:prepilin-type N-terminal cleavage/methylation domain-containing protein